MPTASPSDEVRPRGAAPGWARPRLIDDPADCAFYHTMELPGVGRVEGPWDLRGRVDDYLGGVDVRGKRVLDVGCASGFLSFEMEKRGAEVVSFDADSAERYHLLPFHDSEYVTHPARWRDRTDQWVTRLHNSYWLAHRAYGSANRVYHGNVYDLPAELGPFDICVIGQILIHLRDPIQALASVSRLCGRTMIISEGMLRTWRRIARLDATAKDGPPYHFWQLSRGAYRELMMMLGFRVNRFARHRYPIRSERFTGRAAIWTLVAERVSGAAEHPARP